MPAVEDAERALERADEAWPPAPPTPCGHWAIWPAGALAVMHGSSFRADGGQALYDLAERYERLITAA